MARVLYIEDNADNVYMLRRRLEKRGYEVSIAETAEDGLRLAISERPDLIIVDLLLPGMDGWELASRIRQDETSGATPIVALSSSAMATDRARALENGCDAFESKPVDFPRLLSVMESLLNREG